MSQLFGPHFNGIARFVLWGGAALVLVLIAVAAALPRSALVTGTDRVVAQPVPFSHKHHAGELGIDEVEAEILPDQKSEAVKRLQASWLRPSPHLL